MNFTVIPVLVALAFSASVSGTLSSPVLESVSLFAGLPMLLADCDNGFYHENCFLPCIEATWLNNELYSNTRVSKWYTLYSKCLSARKKENETISYCFLGWNVL